MTYRHAYVPLWRLAVALILTVLLTSPGLALRPLDSHKNQNAKQTDQPTKPLEIMVLRPQGALPTPPTPEEVEAFTKVIEQGHYRRGPTSPEAARAVAALHFRPAAALLRRHGVGFEPYLLLRGDWYRQLWSTLKLLPQFQSRLVVGQQVQGLCVADTVVLPERALVTDDLVIIARQLEVGGKTLELRGPHRIYLFQAEPARFTQAARGQITLNASGCGYAEWREAMANPNSMAAQLCPPFVGAPGSPGYNGKGGDPGEHGHSPPKAPNGTCDNADTIDGSLGTDAGNGSDGKSGKPGGKGNTGQFGREMQCYIPAGDPNFYTFVSQGGVGGIGGRGGNGGPGGDGGLGGEGGDGVACGCMFGRAGTGGTGGSSGRGGMGGDAGLGGDGGDGGEGGKIHVFYCPPEPPFDINIEGGLGNQVGETGDSGDPGRTPQVGGAGGRGGDSFSCKGKPGRQGAFKLPNRPGGYPTQQAQPGKQGKRGVVVRHDMPGCPPPEPPIQPEPPGGGGPIYQCFSWCYYVSYDGGLSWQFLGCDVAGCWVVIVQ